MKVKQVCGSCMENMNLVQDKITKIWEGVVVKVLDFAHVK